MATETEQLVVALEARITQFEKAFARASRTADNQFSAVERRAKQAGDRLDQLMGSTALSVNRALGAIGLGISFEGIRRYADAWTEASNKLRSAAAATGVQVRSLDALKAGANDARTSLESYVDLYARLTRASAGIAKNEDEIARATNILAKAFKASGATASEAAAAALQVGQALGSGVLQGDELRSIKENAQPIAQAIADAFGVPIGALKSLGEQGKLTSDKVFGAILAAGPKIEAQFKATTATIGDSFTSLSNNFTEYVGKIAEASGASAAFRAVIDGLSNNIGAVSNAAAAAAAVLLGSYVPAMLRSAAAGAAMIATNPLLAIAAAAAAAAFALTAFGDKITPISGDLANLQDYAAVAWDEMKSGAIVAADAISNAFQTVVDFTSNALSSIGTSWEDVGAVVKGVATFIVNGMVTAYEVVVATFGKLPQAVAEATIDAVNGLIKRIEDALNAVVEMVNDAVTILNGLLKSPTGIEIGTVGKIDLGRIANDYAGAGAAAGKAYADALAEMTRDRVGEALSAINGQADAALEAWRKRANEHAAARKAAEDAAKTSADTSKTAPIGGRQTMPLEVTKGYTDLQQRITALQAELALRRSITGSVEQVEAALDRQKVAQELVNEAVKEGVVMTDDVKSKIGALADAYSRAAQEAKALAQAQQEAQQKAQDFENTSKDAMKGFITDLANGKSATSALNSALAKLGQKLFDMAFDSVWEQALGKNNPIFSTVANAASPTTAKPAYAPGNPLAGVNFNPTGAINTPSATVTAGTVTVNGGTPTGAPTSALPKGIGSDAVASARAEAAAKAATTPFADSTLNRSSFDAELSNPAVRARLLAMTNAEVGSQGPQAQQAFMETIFNRASARGQTLDQTLRGSYFPQTTYDAAAKVDPAAMEAKYGDMLAKVRAGSNLSNYATGNASGTVGFAGGPQTYAAGGERFGIEGPDAGWAAKMQQAQQAIEQQTQQASQALTKLDQPLQSLGTAATGTVSPLGTFEQGIGSVGTQALSAVPGLGKFGSSITALLSQLGGLGGGGGGLLSLLGFADGGHVSGAGTGTSDSIPAMLSNGEFVVNAKATAANRPVLEAINSGKAPRFATGGIVSSSAFSSTTTNNNINVSAASTGDPRRDRQFGDMLAGKIAAAVNPTDTFRRSEGQQKAAAAAQLQAAGVRNN